MFSAKLERRRKNRRWAVAVAATLLVVGIPLIAIFAVQGFDMLGAAEADRMPIVLGVLIGLAGLIVLCLLAYAAIRIFGRVTSR
jgi:protein-S-isoprenylcysteine O-methyltransferase Ste14